MKSFLFHVYASGDFFADPEGCACDSLRQAKQHARRVADMVVAMAPRSYDWRGWSVLVAEVGGPALVAIPFPPAPQPSQAQGAPAPVMRRAFPRVLGPGEVVVVGPAANEDAVASDERIRRAAVSFGRKPPPALRRGAMGAAIARRAKRRLLGLIGR